MNIFNTLKDLGCIVEPCGSRITVSPPPMDTDADYLVEVPWSLFGARRRAVERALRDDFFRKEGHEYAGGVFKSYRSGAFNLVVTEDHRFAERHRLATHVCKRLNIRQKTDRVSVFQAILYGNKV